MIRWIAVLSAVAMAGAWKAAGAAEVRSAERLFSTLLDRAEGPAKDGLRAARDLIAGQVELLHGIPKPRVTGLVSLVCHLVKKRLPEVLGIAVERKVSATDALYDLRRASDTWLAKARSAAVASLVRFTKTVRFHGVFAALREGLDRGWDLVGAVAKGESKHRVGMMKAHWDGYRNRVREGLDRFRAWAVGVGLEGVRNALYEAILILDEG
jgi:hypothetical protein